MFLCFHNFSQNWNSCDGNYCIDSYPSETKEPLSKFNRRIKTPKEKSTVFSHMQSPIPHTCRVKLTWSWIGARCFWAAALTSCSFCLTLSDTTCSSIAAMWSIFSLRRWGRCEGLGFCVVIYKIKIKVNIFKTGLTGTVEPLIPMSFFFGYQEKKNLYL